MTCNMDNFLEEAEGSMSFEDHRCRREDKLAEEFERHSATIYSSPEPEDPKWPCPRYTPLETHGKDQHLWFQLSEDIMSEEKEETCL